MPDPECNPRVSAKEELQSLCAYVDICLKEVRYQYGGYMLC